MSTNFRNTKRNLRVNGSLKTARYQFHQTLEHYVPGLLAPQITVAHLCTQIPKPLSTYQLPSCTFALYQLAALLKLVANSLQS